MNKILLLALIISSVSTAQNNATLKKEKLNGRVKMLLISDYKVTEKFGKIIKNETDSAVKYFYNNKGFREKRIIYEDEGNPWEIKLYEYGLLGELIKYKIKDSFLDADISDVDREISDLLGYGRFSEYFVNNKYDEKGNVIEDDFGYFWNMTSSTSSQSGITQGSFYLMTSSQPGTNKYNYDNNGNIVRRYVYFDSFNNGLVHDYKYDSNYNLVENLQSLPDGSIQEKALYGYDKKNNCISEIIYQRGKIVSKKTQGYLEFDDNDNWTKSILYENDVPIRMFERDIRYYN